MQSSDVVLWGRDYSAREFTAAEFDRYQRENPGERPVQALGRYIGYPGNSKCISYYPGMYQHHWENGRPVFLFHQIGYTDMAGGYASGRAHAQTALNDARSTRVGWDGESPIVACMDRFYAKVGYTTLTREQLREYMRGFRSVLGYDLSGFYGFFDSMAHAIAERWASFNVQCGARSAHVSGIQAWQENNYQPKIFGTGTDILEIYTNPFGGAMSAEQAKEGFKQLLSGIEDGTEPWAKKVLQNLFLDAEVEVVDNRQLVPDDKDPTLMVPARWKDSVRNVVTSTNRHAAWSEKNTDELIKRAVEEIDEAELAEELHKLGWDGANATEVKDVLADLLSRVTLGVVVPGQPT
jgi:hypothetical protein